MDSNCSDTVELQWESLSNVCNSGIGIYHHSWRCAYSYPQKYQIEKTGQHSKPAVGYSEI